MTNQKQTVKRAISLLVMVSLILSVVLVPGMIARAASEKIWTLSGPPTEYRTMSDPAIGGYSSDTEITFEVTPGEGFGTNTNFCVTYFNYNDPIHKPTNVATLNKTAFRFYTEDDQSYYPALYYGREDQAWYDTRFFMTQGVKYEFKLIVDSYRQTNSLYVKQANEAEYTAIAVSKPFFMNKFTSLAGSSSINVIFTDHTMFPWENMQVKNLVKTPTAGLADGTYKTPQTLQLNCETGSANIYYTTDGKDPTVASTLYSPQNPIAITGKTLIKAAAFAGGDLRSDEIIVCDYDVVPTHEGVYGVDKYAKQDAGSTVYNEPIVQAQYEEDDVDKMLIYPLGKSYSGDVYIEFDLTMTEPYGTFSIGFGPYDHSAPSKNAQVIKNFQDYRKTYANIFYRPVQGVNSQAFCARQNERPPVGFVSTSITATGPHYYYLNRVAYSSPASKVPVKVHIDTENNVYSYWVNGALIAKEYTPLVAPFDNVGVMGVNTRLNDITIENLTIQSEVVEEPELPTDPGDDDGDIFADYGEDTYENASAEEKFETTEEITFKMFRIGENNVNSGQDSDNMMYSHSHLEGSTYQPENTYELNEVLNLISYADGTRADMTIGFSLQYTQRVNVEIWKVDPDAFKIAGDTELDPENNEQGSEDAQNLGVGLYSLKDNPEYIEGGDDSTKTESQLLKYKNPRATRVGYIVTSDIKTLKNHYAKGHSGLLPESTPDPNMNPTDVTNAFKWRGDVVDENDDPVSLENGTYVMVIQPLGVGEVTWPKIYRSHALITIDGEETITAGKVTGDDTYESVADPINMANGNFYWEHTGLSIVGRDAFDFGVFYSAQSTETTAMGYGWEHSHMYRVKDEILNAVVSLPTGNKIVYNKKSDGSFQKPTNTKYELFMENNQYVLVKPTENLTYRFDFDGKLQSVSNIRGILYTYTYSGDKLTQIRHGDDTFTLAYNDDKISGVTDNYNRQISFEHTGDNLMEYTNPDGNTIRFEYDENNRAEKLYDFMGNLFLHNTYDDRGRIKTQYMLGMGNNTFDYFPAEQFNIHIDAAGDMTKYHYNGIGDIVKIEYENGEVVRGTKSGYIENENNRLGENTSTVRDENFNVTDITNPDGSTKHIDYNEKNLPVKITFEDGTIVQYEYDGNGNVKKQIDQKGNATSFTYDSDNNMKTQTDAMGNVTKFDYDSRGNMTEMTNALNGVYSYEYDDFGRLVKSITAEGLITEYVYSPAGKLLSTKNNVGDMQRFVVDANGNTTDSTDFMGYTTVTQYSATDVPVSVTDPEGGVVTYEYDAAGRLKITTDRDGGSTTYTYGLYGNIETVADAMGNVTTFEYDAEGRLKKTINPLGYVNVTDYDAMGRVDKSTNELGAIYRYEYDLMGRVTKEIDSLGNITETKYDDKGNVEKRIDAEGNVTQYEYDVLDRLVKTIDAKGYETDYTYDKIGRQTAVLNSENSTTSVEFDLDGKVMYSTDAMGNKTKNEYDQLGRIVKRINPDDTFITYDYDKNSRLVKTANEAGEETLYTYDKNGNMLTVTDPMGGTTTYTYTPGGRQQTVTDALGATTTYVYNANGNVSKTIDALGNATQYEYNALNQLSASINPVGGRTEYFYDATGAQVKVVNPDGGITTSEYDLAGRLVSTTGPENSITSYEYDKNGQLVKTTDALGNVTSFVYNQLGQQVQTKNADDGTTATTYDSLGRQITFTNEEGAVTTYTYDRNGNILKMADALGNETSFKYDVMGRIVAETDQKGATTKYEYDEVGNVTVQTDKSGQKTLYTYNVSGQVLTETNAQNETTSYTYDVLGRMQTSKNALGETTHFTYDVLGRIKTTTNPKGNVSTNVYDANGNVVEQIDGNGNSIYFEYDTMSRLVKVKLNNTTEQVTVYRYDKRGLVVEEINALGDNKIFIYDKNGNLISQTDEDGNVIEYAYNSLNMVREINYSPEKQVSYAYNKAGQLVEINDWNGMTAFELDLLGRKTKVTDHNSRATGYEYNEMGAKTAIVYPDGTTVNYQYDVMDRLVKVTEPNKQVTAYQYDKIGRLKRTTYPNGEQNDYAYNRADRLVETIEKLPDGSTRRQYQYKYDDNGNVISEYIQGEGLMGSQKSTYFGYDGANQLVKTEEQYRSVKTYAYDAAGNLITETDGTKRIGYTYNALNQLIARQAPEASVVYSYDKRGNLIEEVKDGIIDKTYVYDQTNRLIFGSNKDGEESEYNFNALGALVQTRQTVININQGYSDNQSSPGSSRIGDLGQYLEREQPEGHMSWQDETGATRQQTIQQVTRDYVVDYTTATRESLMVYEQGAYAQRFTYGFNKIAVTLLANEAEDNIKTDIALNDNGRFYFHQSRLGTSMYTTRENTKVASFYSYDEWGNPRNNPRHDINQAGLDGAATDYTGYDYDVVLEKYFAQARFYDSANKRFVARDPVKSGKNWYAYCANDPVNNVDPMGLANLKNPYNGITHDIGSAFNFVGKDWYKLRDVIRAISTSKNETLESAVTVGKDGKGMFRVAKGVPNSQTATYRMSMFEFDMGNLKTYTKGWWLTEKEYKYNNQFLEAKSSSNETLNLLFHINDNNEGNLYINIDDVYKIMNSYNYFEGINCASADNNWTYSFVEKEFPKKRVLSQDGKNLLRKLELQDYQLADVGVYEGGSLVGIKPYYVMKNNPPGFKDDGGITIGYGHHINAKEWALQSDPEHQLLASHIPANTAITGMILAPGTLPRSGLIVVPNSTAIPISDVNRIFDNDVRDNGEAISNWLIGKNIVVTDKEFDALVIYRFNRGSLSDNAMAYLENGNRNKNDWNSVWTGGDNRREACQRLFFGGSY